MSANASNNQTIKSQNLSDFLDGQASDAAIEALLSEPQVQQDLYRYHTVQAGLKQQLSAYNNFDLTQSISSEIAKEPSLASDTENHSNIIQFPSWKRKLTGVSIAASVALATVVSVQMFSGSGFNSNGLSSSSNSAKVNALVSQEKSRTTDQIASEQAKLEQIQQMLERSNQQFLQANEELVGGDFMTKSIVIDPQKLKQTQEQAATQEETSQIPPKKEQE
jgi:negative regulator of sigma E activity